MPPQPGTYLYAHTKYLGQEICRVFTESHDVHVMALLFYMFLDAETHRYLPDAPATEPGQDFTPFTVSWRDSATAFTRALEIDFDRLPSKFETFFVFPDLPHRKFDNEKVKRILGWQAQDGLDQFWRKAPPG